MVANRRHSAQTSAVHRRPRGENAETEYEYTWW